MRPFARIIGIKKEGTMSNKTTFNLVFLIITISTVILGAYQNWSGIGTGLLFVTMLSVYYDGDNPED